MPTRLALAGLFCTALFALHALADALSARTRAIIGMVLEPSGPDPAMVPAAALGEIQVVVAKTGLKALWDRSPIIANDLAALRWE
jgi:hypothetical protein